MKWWKVELFQIKTYPQNGWMRWNQGTLGSTTITVSFWFSLFSEHHDKYKRSSSTGFELHFSHCKSFGFKLLKCCSKEKRYDTVRIEISLLKLEMYFSPLLTFPTWINPSLNLCSYLNCFRWKADKLHPDFVPFSVMAVRCFAALNNNGIGGIDK